jgi:hypothetical protein
MGDQINLQESEETGRAHQANSRGGLWIWLPLILILYLLSVGPAVRIHDRTTSAALRNTIEGFYAPIESLQSTPLRAPLDWWVSLWRHGL